MKRTYFQRFIRFFTITLLLWACNPEQIPEPLNQTEWLERADGFQDKYELEQMVVLSRHNIRTPLVGKGSAAYPDTTSFSQFPSSVGFKLNAEPFMNGGLKMACTVSDALVLQYYEEPDARKAAFGYEMGADDWVNVALVKEWYGDVLFTAPSVAVNVAHPLLQTMLSELQQDNRIFTFLCGHDSNIGSVLAALDTKAYDVSLKQL